LGLRKSETVSLRLDAYESAVELEEARNATLTSRLSLENARNEWKLYAESIDSKLARISLNNAELTLNGKTVTATVGSLIDQNNLKAELLKVTDVLRSRLNDRAIVVEVQLDEQKAVTQSAARPARPLTAREKLDKMRESNPLIDDLIRTFDLKPDD
ncbi:MAG: hypothetical protein ACKOCH_16575, partial [Bacteroidota bacterium]